MSNNIQNLQFDASLNAAKHKLTEAKFKQASPEKTKQVAQELFATLLETAFKEAFHYEPPEDLMFTGGNAEKMSRRLLQTEYMKELAKDKSMDKFVEPLYKELLKQQEIK